MRQRIRYTRAPRGKQQHDRDFVGRKRMFRRFKAAQTNLRRRSERKANKKTSRACWVAKMQRVAQQKMEQQYLNYGLAA